MSQTLKLDDQVQSLPSAMKWTRRRYDLCVEEGVFTSQDRIELLDGEILEMSPQHTPHSVAITLAQESLRSVFGGGHVVRVQLPFALDDQSEPEPDVAIVKGEPRDFLAAHPSEALLIVEIADSSLEYDRGRKLAAYARNGVPEFWIVNLLDRQIEVRRGPRKQTEDYSDLTVFRPGESLAPLAQPNHQIPADELLP